MSKTSKTIQGKTEKLSEIISWFNSVDFSLEIAIEKFKEAEKLATEIEQDLLSLKNDIQIIKQKFDSDS